MAKRKHKQHRVLDSSDVQGEGSFVKIKNISLSDIMSLSDDVGSELSEDAAKSVGMKILAKMVVEWNWVDDDDQPLPTPAEKPELLLELPFQEAQWLLQESGVQDMLNQKN